MPEDTPERLEYKNGFVPESRAVLRRVEAGSLAICVACEKPITFKAKAKLWQVIANVYVGQVWDRIEQYHETCYEEAGSPYGKARDTALLTKSSSQGSAG